MTNSLPTPCAETSVRPSDGAGVCSKASARWVLAATILGSSLAFIDGTVVNIVLPALQQKLHATATDVQWVVEAYSLLLAGLLLVGGSLGDHYGRRRIFIIGVALFALASTACGLAANIAQLIAARAVQGLGAALLVPGSLAIISSSFREEERGRAIGTWSGFSAITAAIGPVLGGWLIEHFSWRAVFFINLPLAAIVIALSYWHVPESSAETKEPLDWWGALLAALGLGALVYGLIESSRLGFRHPAVVSALVAAALLLALFGLRESRAKNPMLPFDLFRSPTFTGANLLTLFLYGALSGALFFLPLNLIQVQRYSPAAAGAAILPLILIIFFLSRWSGGLVEKYGAKIPLIIGPLIAACGFALFILPGIGGSYARTFLPAVLVLGVGMAISVAPLTTAVMNSVAQSRAGIASGINNAVSRAAGLLAIAVFGIVMLQTFDRALQRNLAQQNLPNEIKMSIAGQSARLAAIELPQELNGAQRAAATEAIDQSFLRGFRLTMAIAAGLALASSFSAGTLISGKTKPRASP
ncbi:MAG: MFS transporter [Chthoniobacterales bacterium]|nr:MFS transporter [Chthoniobacterales bacterium]